MRIRRADLPEQNSQAVYQRMQTERQREAAEFRAQGSQKSQEIRAKADRDVTVLVADANSQAEQIRGQGDGERNRIFADAYGQDPDFFAFYRSMQAYERSLQSGDTRLVLRPDSDFFRYFGDPSGKTRGRAAGTAGRRAQRRRSVSGAAAAPQARAIAAGGAEIGSGVGNRPGSMSDFLAALGLVFAIEGIFSRPSRAAPSAPWRRCWTCRTAACASSASSRQLVGRGHRLAGARLNAILRLPLFRPNPVPNGAKLSPAKAWVLRPGWSEPGFTNSDMLFRNAAYMPCVQRSQER